MSSPPTPGAQRTPWLAQFFRGSVQYSSQLVGGLGARLDCGTAGHAQHADRLDHTVTLLGYPQCLTGEHGPRGRLSIARVTLAIATCWRRQGFAHGMAELGDDGLAEFGGHEVDGGRRGGLGG